MEELKPQDGTFVHYYFFVKNSLTYKKYGLVFLDNQFIWIFLVVSLLTQGPF